MKILLAALIVFALSGIGAQAAPSDYTVGERDVLEIDVLKPEQLVTVVGVAPDGTFNYPYIGSVYAKGRTIAQIQNEIQSRLAHGYMKYPVVVVYLKDSQSRQYFVYGEVEKPGPYPIVEGMTVLKAISTAGGFTKFGSATHVQLLRPRVKKQGYDVIKVNVKQIMSGKNVEDLQISPGDVVMVKEGLF